MQVLQWEEALRKPRRVLLHVALSVFILAGTLSLFSDEKSNGIDLDQNLESRVGFPGPHFVDVSC